jgi:hypothetical protein
MSELSRLRSGRLIVLRPAASAANTRARLVIDFEPGTCTVADTGAVASGAGQVDVFTR